MTVPPDDPLGPVAQDPDAIRDAACRLVETNRVCTPTTATSKPASGGAALGDLFSVFVWILFVGLVVALVVLVVRALLRRSPRRRRAKRSHTDVDDEGEDIVRVGRTAIDRGRSPAEWRAEADEHRRAGRHRDAVRCRYRALVGDLARRDVIDEIPGRTSGEERRQLATVSPDGTAPFSSAADLFDGAWYGHVDVADADVERMIVLEDEVLRRVAVRRDAS